MFNPIAYTQVNITPYVDDLTNLSDNMLYSAFATYSSVLGANVFWTLIFSIIGIVIHLLSKKNTLITLAYLCGVIVFCAGLLLTLAVIFFGFISAFLGASILFKSLVKKSS